MEKKMVTELETFIPQDGSTVNGTSSTKYKINKNNDLEASFLPTSDPFKNRDLEHPVTDCDTLTHLLKASLGSGILSMPAAFKESGLALGIFATVAVAIICTHCAYILVTSAHELYKRTGKSVMGFAEVAEEACNTGPKWVRGYGQAARIIILISLFVTYFATCSCYTVLIAENFNRVANHYLGYEVDNMVTIGILIVPLLLLSYIPNLKSLAPVSMVANGFMAIGLGITFYYLVADIPPISSRNLSVSDISTFPVFFSLTIFAIEAIGVVMPLENNMQTPQHFVGLCGVLNQGMSGVTLAYILLGFFGYLKYGPGIKGSVTLNLPVEEYAAQAVQILIGSAVFCTFGLQFFVCLEISWNGIRKRVSDGKLANYILRTVLVILCVLLAIAVRAIVPFVGIIGAFCFSILGLMLPVMIEVITFWDKGFGKFHWKIFKNIIVVIVGILALIFGTKSAVQDIIRMYTN